MTRNYDAFTLAEVLITLVIVGVIAAMTIPTLMNNTNKQEYVSKLKKAYSTMAQATNRIIADNGMPRGDIGGWATSNEAVFNMYKKYLSKTGECSIGTNGCFEGIYKHFNNTNVGFNPQNSYAIVMADGTEILFAQIDFRTDCSKTSQGTNNQCQIILVDINGAKKPNVVGKDTFAFSLVENGLVPTGCDYNNCSGAGWGCTCRAIKEGAINYY